MNKKLDLGYTGTYIRDYNSRHIADLPESAAVEWVKKAVPGIALGSGTLAGDLTTNESSITDASKGGWLNKLFVVVGCEHGKYIALYKNDEKFSVRVIKHKSELDKKAECRGPRAVFFNGK